MQNFSLKNVTGLGIVVVGLFLFTWVLNLQKISHLPMGSYHAWRQADCISLTHNLYEGTGTLWHPRTHYAKDDGSGLAAGELPLLNAMVAGIFKVTGKSNRVYRLTIFLFYITGIIFLYLLFLEVSRHPFFSAGMALLIGSSPVLLYYAINFLPDVPALSTGIAGLYVTTLAKRKNRFTWMIAGITLIALASLMKLTLAILLVGLAIVYLVEILMHGKKRWNIQALVGIGFCVLVIAGWYYHAYWLDHLHPPFIFLTETRSYWQTYYLEKPLIWHEVVHRWLPQVLLPLVWLFILVSALAGALFPKKVKIEWTLLGALGVIMAVIFFLLLYRQFYLHDYLWIGLLGVVVVLAIMAVQAMAGLHNRSAKIALQGGIGLLIILQIFQARLTLQERYIKFDNALLFNQQLWQMEPELRKHGIKKTDLVISIPDVSPNLSLVAMNQYGFTNYREKNNDSLGITRSISAGASYLIISDTALYKKTWLQPFLQQYAWSYKDIGVFDLRPFKNIQTNH
jgi:hypothetical protein